MWVLDLGVRVYGPGCLLLGFRKVLQCCVGFRGMGVSRSGSGLPFMWSYRGFQGSIRAVFLKGLYRYSTRMEKFVKDRLDLCML